MCIGTLSMCENSFRDGASHRGKVGALPTITGNLLEEGGGGFQSQQPCSVIQEGGGQGENSDYFSHLLSVKRSLLRRHSSACPRSQLRLFISRVSRGHATT